MTGQISAVDDLEDVCRKYEIIIIYGAGVVGSLLVQYMLKNGYSNKLFCVAIKSMEDNPNNILGVPVCELKDLKDYKDTALFIVGTYENFQTEILEELKEFGCTEVRYMKNILCAVLRKSSTDFSVENNNMLYIAQKMLKETFRAIKKLEEKVDALQESNEVCSVNYDSFHRFENRFRDKEVVIVGAGPTLNYYTPIEGAIHIGVNTTYRYDKVDLDYLFVQDANREIDYKERFRGIEKLNCHIFMGRFLRISPERDIEFPENYRISTNISNYYLDAYPSQHIYRDICFHPLMSFGSIIFPAIHFALYTYPKKLYLVGCDVNKKGYFFQSDQIVQRMPEESIKNLWFPGYQRIKEYAQIHYPDTEIISVNPVGLQGMFHDIYTADYPYKAADGKEEYE